MRKAEQHDVLQLTEVYSDALEHANNVGHIDWPSPLTVDFVSELVSTCEIYCFGDDQILAAAKVSASPDTRIWKNVADSGLYLAKIATSNQVRGTNYFEQSMLAEIVTLADATTPKRLDCLADNPRLKAFYSNIGFRAVGDVTFYSEKQSKPITVSRFEMD